MGKRAIATMLAVPLATASLLAQAPTTSQPTMIFFGWDKPEIDEDAAATLGRVAATVSISSGDRLRIVGHSDRSGPAAFNRQSSRKRAEAVRDFLAARGVPATAMSTLGLGEDQPLIATEDGVREPQNRRVDIYLIPGDAR